MYLFQMKHVSPDQRGEPPSRTRAGFSARGPRRILTVVSALPARCGQLEFHMSGLKLRSSDVELGPRGLALPLRWPCQAFPQAGVQALEPPKVENPS